MASFSVWRRRGLWATSVVALGAVLATTTPSRAVEFWNGSASTDWFNGGAVSNVYGFIGDFSGATGAVTVDGAGSTWTNSADLDVGAYGSGTLTIRNGGAVSNVYGFIGYDSSATGFVTVDGAGSTWTN